MPLEATMLLIDNSEYMRNGDYQPTRFDAQSDAVNSIFQTKIDSNPENTVGIMTMAGNGPEVLVTHTKELGQVLGAVHKAANKLAGEADIPTSIAIAQLALKHRQNKNLRQRIVVLLASPLSGAGADERGMIRLAKKLKKNNVAVDIVAFGDAVEEDAGATNVLRAFVDNANSGDNSLRAISSTYSCASFAHQPPLVLLYRRLLNVPPGAHLLSEAIMRSPILASDLGIPEGLGNEGGPSGAGGAGGQEFEFGVDPSIDPELAMALRMSMQEEEARRAAAAASTASPAPVTGAAAASAPANPTDDESAGLLQQSGAQLQGESGGDVDMAAGGGAEDEEMSEEEAIARAIEMSMEEVDGDGEDVGKK